ncbi:MAG: TonB-dependent receptor [Bryobacteraceae bacterium]
MLRTLIAGALVLAGAAFAQTDTATITGLITDTSGAAVPEASVQAVNRANGLIYRATSNESGAYVITALPVAAYEIEFTKQGFQTVKRADVALHAGDRARIDLQLTVGAVSEVVEVSGAVPLLQAETSSLDQVIENATIVNMPLNGRNYQQLALLVPGVLPSRARNFVTDAFSVNGANMWQNQFVMDGADNNNYSTGVVIASNQVVKPSVDAIQEFKIDTHNISAEFGRGGGGVIQVTTKSGTNEFHGALFEFLRNDKLDANDFFNSGRAKPPFRLNQFGGTIGGPIRRDRTFFFASHQGTRIREKLTRLGVVPDLAMKQGNFGSIGIYDPATQDAAGLRQRFPNNAIPASRVDPVSVQLLNLYPDPNRAGVQNFVFNSPRNDRDDQIDTRFDHRFRESDTMFLRYSYHDRFRLEGGGLPVPASGGDTATRIAKAHSAVFSETHIFGGASLVNEFRLAYTRNAGLIDTANRERLWEQFGFKGLFDRADIAGLPFFSLTGFANIGDRSFAPDPKNVDVRQLVDNLSWNRGRHSVRFGGNLRQFLRYSGTTDFARGRFFFNGQFTAAQAGRGAGNSFADALLGYTNTASLSTPRDATQVSLAQEYYVQDNFKVTSKLTLNLGFRYEYQQPYWEKRDRVANFQFEPGQPGFGTLVRVSGGGAEARSFQQRDANNFAPRIGFAFQLTPKTVIRSGYGIFYDGLAQLPAGSQPFQNPPFYLAVDIPSPSVAQRSNVIVRDGFAASALNPDTINGRSLATVWPFAFPEGITHQWNINIQQTVFGNAVASAAYVGTNTGHRRLTAIDRNQPEPGPGAIGPRRAFPNLATIQTDVPFGTANYQGLELKFEKRFRSGLSSLNGYTWSKTMAGEIGQRSTILAPEKALSPEDMRQRFFSSIVWEIPLGKGHGLAKEGIAARVLGGWQLSTLFAAQSGLPLTPGLGTNLANSTGGVRPDRIGNGNLPRDQRKPERWFDTTAFTTFTGFRFGNSGRNVITGPGLVNLDATVARNFDLTERIRLQFRAEGFNVLNEAHFNLPNGTVDRPVGGQISSVASSMRQFQFALKLIY